MIKPSEPTTKIPLTAIENSEKVSEAIAVDTNQTIETTTEPKTSVEKAPVTRRIAVSKPSLTVVKAEEVLQESNSEAKQETIVTMKDSDKEKAKSKAKKKEKKVKAKKEKLKAKEKAKKVKAKKVAKEKKAKAKKAKVNSKKKSSKKKK